MALNSCRIYYSCMKVTPEYIDVPISRWDEDNWGVTLEFFCNATNRNTLFSHLVPGQVTEQENILGKPTYIDTTYNSGNTLRINPLDDIGLDNLRNNRVIGVKSISDTFITPDLFSIKIEGKRVNIW